MSNPRNVSESYKRWAKRMNNIPLPPYLRRDADVANVHLYPFTAAMELAASELRLAYAKGERAGVASALEGARGEKREVAA